MKPKKPNNRQKLDMVVSHMSDLESQINALNTAVACIFIASKLTGKELDKITPEQYGDNITGKLHPLIVQGNKLLKELIDGEMKEEKADE